MLTKFWNWAMGVDPRATEIISFCCLFVWGVVVAFGAWVENPTYISLVYLADPVVWSGIALGIAWAQGWSILDSKDSWLPPVACGLAMAFWFMVAGFTIQVDWDNPTPYVYGVLGVANAWAAAQQSR